MKRLNCEKVRRNFCEIVHMQYFIKNAHWFIFGSANKQLLNVKNVLGTENIKLPWIIHANEQCVGEDRYRQ